MIKLEKISYPILIAAHAILAISIVVLPFLIQPIFYGLVIYFGIRIFSSRDKNCEVLLACAYMATFEVFLRMNDALFFYEFIKYLVIAYMLIGIGFKGFSLKSIPYFIYLLLFVPSIIVASQNIPLGESLRTSVAFNLSGPVTLGVVALYSYQRELSMNRLHEILKLCIGPIVTLTMYLFLVTPDIRDAVTDTASNFATSGGYGPNQVATILGLGMFLCFTRFLLIRNLITNIIDIVLLLAMTFRGWVTFSRGGIFTAAIMIVATVLMFVLFNRKKVKFSILPKISIVALGLMMAWGFTSLATNGLIDKRYANQDAAGRAKEDLSTGRETLITIELEAFAQNPVLGIGAGQVKYYRAKKDGIVAASHNETSRLLSEHGAVGILSLLILIFVPLFYRITHRKNLYFFAFLIFWLATINHSAMRIAAPAVFYGFVLLKVVPYKKVRKRTKEERWAARFNVQPQLS